MHAEGKPRRARKVKSEIKRGQIFKRAYVIWPNTYNKFDPPSPFGGYKESGFGREGGLHGLAAYCRVDCFLGRYRIRA